MKPSALKFAAALLITLASTAILSAPRGAQACDPPQEGISVSWEGIDFEQSVPINGAWAFRASTYSAPLDDLSVEVRDASDELVSGSVSEVVVAEYNLGSPYESANWLII